MTRSGVDIPAIIVTLRRFGLSAADVGNAIGAHRNNVMRWRDGTATPCLRHADALLDLLDRVTAAAERRGQVAPHKLQNLCKGAERERDCAQG